MSELALNPEAEVLESRQANLPSEPPELTVSEASPEDNGLRSRVNQFLEQPAVKKSIPTASALLVLGFCLILYFWISAPGLRPVSPGMPEIDRQTAYEALMNGGFKVEIDQNTGEVLVENDRYHAARILLASQNIPKSAPLGTIGTLVEQGSLTTSRFMEQVSYRAAMESELATTISQIASISSARVHIAESQQSVFVRNQTPSKASVVVSPHAGRSVSRPQIQAIVHLVSSSIPYLTKDNVTVVDDTGQLLTGSEGASALSLTTAQTEHRSFVEQSYQQRIQELVSAVVGLGNVRSEVDVSLNFTEVESTYEAYDRDNNGPRTRSESLQFEKDSAAAAEGVPGSFSNEPPESPTFTQTTETRTTATNADQDVSSSSTTRNYELDREIRYVKQQVGDIERISVAVVINESVYASDDDTTNDAALEKELENIEEMVKGAVGYSESRGDQINVVATKFAQSVEYARSPWYLEPEIMDDLIRIGAIIFVLSFVYLLIARPLIKSSQQSKFEVPDEDLGADEITDEERQLVEMGDVETIQDVTARLKPKAVGIPAEYLDTSQPYDQKVALMRFLVKDDVGRVSNLLKRWIE